MPAKIPVVLVDGVPSKRCTKCNSTKPLIEFSKRPKNKTDGRGARCKLCIQKYTNASYWANHTKRREQASGYYQNNRATWDSKNQTWRKKNPKKTKAIYRRYYRKHREQAMQKSFNRQSLQKTRGNGKRINRMEIYNRDGGICHLCHRKVSPKHFSLDHLIPLSQGGLHIASNVALAHTQCNKLRGAGRCPAQLRLF